MGKDPKYQKQAALRKKTELDYRVKVFKRPMQVPQEIPTQIKEDGKAKDFEL